MKAGLWKHTEVAIKTYQNYVLRSEDRYTLLSLFHRWALCKHPGILPVGHSIPHHFAGVRVCIHRRYARLLPHAGNARHPAGGHAVLP